MIRVLIADDQAMARRGFRLVLEEEDDMEVMGEAGDASRRSPRRGDWRATSC